LLVQWTGHYFHGTRFGYKC